MFNKTKRPYKDSSAKETINKIQGILKGLNLAPTQSFRANPYPEIYSMRLELPKEMGSFGTNGKGRTEEYSIASGYAEFLERMQNGLFTTFSRTMVSEVKKKNGFYYNPDETYLSKHEFTDFPDAIMADIIRHSGEGKEEFINSYFNRLAVNNISGAVAVPFYDTQQNSLFYMPINLLLITVGSNGMAAGNTTAEAIFQAICELTERWGAAEIFYNQLTPPTVPDEYLQQFKEECRMIRNIEENGKYSVTVKDFSGGKRIPSVAILVQDKEAGKYKLNVGSDTSFQVALSRCLTEIYQGIESEEAFRKRLLDIPKEVPEYFLSEDSTSLFHRYRQYNEFTKDGSGQFPPSLFGENPSYIFDPSVFTTRESYEKEVQEMIKTFHQQGYNVYIRDVSFTGFPSVFVYIPEVSALGRKNAPVNITSKKFNIIELDKVEPLFFDLKNLSKEDKRKVAETLECFDPRSRLFNLFNVKLNIKPVEEINVAYFMTLLWYHLGEMSKAHESFNTFMEKRSDKENNDYYKMVAHYFNLKAEGTCNEEIPAKLMELKEEQMKPELVTEVIEDLRDSETILRFLDLPVCPRCNECPLNQKCLTKNNLVVTDNIYPMMKNNMPKQDTLAWVND